MKNLKSLFFMLLCFVIFAVVGCGGSSNHVVSQNPNTQEIPDEFFALETVGITAGASTPDDTISAVEERLIHNCTR